MAEDDTYTQDGTLDINKNPANRRKTGNWKACRFILGIVLSLFLPFVVTNCTII
jgi:hypothetical protein